VYTVTPPLSNTPTDCWPATNHGPYPLVAPVGSFFKARSAIKLLSNISHEKVNTLIENKWQRRARSGTVGSDETSALEELQRKSEGSALGAALHGKRQPYFLESKQTYQAKTIAKKLVTMGRTGNTPYGQHLLFVFCCCSL